MNSIQFNHKTWQIPATWGEVNRQQMLSIGKFYPLADLPHVRVNLLLEWLNLDAITGFQFRKVDAYQVSEMVKLLDFVFGQAILTASVIKAIPINKLIYYGPTDELMTMTTGQWRTVEPFVAEYQQSGHPDMLNAFMAAMYRTTGLDKLYTQATEAYYRSTVGQRADLFKQVPDFIKHACLIEYMALRQHLIESNRDVLPKPDKKTPAGGPKMNWDSIVMSMAPSAADVEDIDRMPIWDFFRFMNTRIKKQS